MAHPPPRDRGPVAEVVVTAPPELDVTTAPGFRDHVAVYLTMGPRAVVVDLGGTTFVDSSGIGALIGLTKQARDLGIRLSLRNVRPNAQSTFRLSGAANVLDIEHPD
jgi:anti-sigma B factor antagonist